MSIQHGGAITLKPVSEVADASLHMLIVSIYVIFSWYANKSR